MTSFGISDVDQDPTVAYSEQSWKTGFRSTGKEGGRVKGPRGGSRITKTRKCLQRRPRLLPCDVFFVEWGPWGEQGLKVQAVLPGLPPPLVSRFYPTAFTGQPQQHLLTPSLTTSQLIHVDLCIRISTKQNHPTPQCPPKTTLLQTPAGRIPLDGQT